MLTFPLSFPLSSVEYTHRSDENLKIMMVQGEDREEGGKMEMKMHKNEKLIELLYSC